MNEQNPLLPLISQLAKLPGIGQKSAQRLAFFLLSLPKSEVTQFSEVIKKTRETIRYCTTCFNISIQETCYICQDPKRDKETLCVLAEPKDMFAMERTGEFKGVYHVLGGLISPIDGYHPETLRIGELIKKIANNIFKEVVFAINPTIEGDATCLYLTQLLSPYSLLITKLAYGLPMGADMDYVDDMTLQKSFLSRNKI